MSSHVRARVKRVNTVIFSAKRVPFQKKRNKKIPILSSFFIALFSLKAIKESHLTKSRVEG